MGAIFTIPRAIAGGVMLALLIWCLVQRTDLVRKDLKIASYDAAMQRAKANLDLSAERIRSARASAAASDQARARAIEQFHTQASQEAARDIETNQAHARALTAAYARGVRDSTQGAPAAGSGGGKADGGGASGPAAGADDAGRMSVVAEDDLRICADNTVKALGWPAWWAKIEAAPK